MNIEEEGFRKPLADVADVLGYIHMSESHRGLVGSGTVNWDEVFAGLAAAHYAGPLVLESFAAINPDLVAATCLWRLPEPAAGRAGKGGAGVPAGRRAAGRPVLTWLEKGFAAGPILEETISMVLEYRRTIMRISSLLVLGVVLAGCNQQTRQSSSGGGTLPAAPMGSAGDPAQKKREYLIGMSQANKGEPWRQAMNDQIAAAAVKHPELKVVFADAAQNNAKQVADVENFLQQGIDLLIISPNEAAPLTDVVAKVYDKGIPVILLDRKVMGEKYTMHIGADNVEIGRKAGEYAAKWCKDSRHTSCTVIEIRGLEGTSGTKERGDGFRDGIKGNPNVKIVAQQNADWLREKAISVSQAMLQANPNVNVVYAQNDPMGEAAIISAQNARLDRGKMLFIGVDGLPTPDGGLKSVAEGRLGVTYVYPTGGAQAIEWALKILRDGQKPPRSVVLDTEEVTKENAAQVYQRYGGK